MDYRLYILAGTFLLLVFALVVFLSVLSRSRREEKFQPAQMLEHHPATLAGSLTRVDTDLGGLEVSLSPDASSASLLTPLRTGAWQPPEQPAPVERLSEAALTDRITQYAPPAIREPQAPVAEYSAWEVNPPVEDVEVEPVALHEPSDLPPAPRTMPAILIPEVRPAETDDDFAAEIAALLPAVDPGDGVEAVAEPEARLGDVGEVPAEMEADVLDGLRFEPQSEPESEEPAEPALEPESEPEAEPELELELEPGAEPESEPRPVFVMPSLAPADQPFIEEDELTALEPLPVIVPEDTPPADQVVAGGDDGVIEIEEITSESPDELWQALLREQQGQRSMVPVLPVDDPSAHADVAAVPDEMPSTPLAPAVVLPVGEPLPLAAPVPPAPAPLRPRVQASVPSADRPRARVAALDSIVGGPLDGEPTPIIVPVPDGSREQAAGEMTLAAPVEMWFGDARVGVKAGSATYDRFRKYADVLLGDLKDAKGETR